MNSSLKLCDIAAWQLRHLVPNHAAAPSWVAALPSLQRDAVWKAGQIELLWDSLFRGFPIGSLVMSEELERQGSRFGKIAGNTDPWPELPKGHLLDGQQRCNAITLGFFDPFGPCGKAGREETSILWLDLSPDLSLFPSGSTRHFLFRVTTLAHPWGYNTTDAAGRLAVGEIRDCLSTNDAEFRNAECRRPSPANLCPWKATTPIPAAWLLLEAKQRVGQDLWASVRERCEQVPQAWAKRVAAFLAVPDSRLKEIEKGVRRALLLKTD